MEATNLTNTLLTEFKNYLRINGITTEMSDADLELLLNQKTSELIAYTGLELEPTTHTEIKNNYQDNFYEVDYYPIKSITSFQVGSRTLTGDDYVVDCEQGILYLHSSWNGLLRIEYVSCLTDALFSSKVKPLLFDMCRYMLTSSSSGVGAMSSIKEGDVQVNYDTSSSLGNLIVSRMNNLRSMYSCRVKVI